MMFLNGGARPLTQKKKGGFYRGRRAQRGMGTRAANKAAGNAQRAWRSVTIFEEQLFNMLIILESLQQDNEEK